MSGLTAGTKNSEITFNNLATVVLLSLLFNVRHQEHMSRQLKVAGKNVSVHSIYHAMLNSTSMIDHSFATEIQT